MLIAGFQKISLLDYPGVLASIVFTQGCAFRCGYCHNPELIPLRASSPLIPEQVVFDSLGEKRKIIEGVVITGGEPTMQPDLEVFVRRVKSLGLLVKLDTNGTRPDVVRRMLDGRLLDYIAMDIKNTWDRYEPVTRVTNPAVVLKCRETFELIQSSSISHEFRTTLYPGVHREDDIRTIVSYLQPGETYYIQQFRNSRTLTSINPLSSTFDAEALARELQKDNQRIIINIR